MEFWKSRGGRARATQTQVSIRYTLTTMGHSEEKFPGKKRFFRRAVRGDNSGEEGKQDEKFFA